VLATLQYPKSNIVDPAVAESFIVLRSIPFAKEMGWQKVKVEGDTIQAVQAIRQDSKNWCLYEQLIDDACMHVLNPFNNGGCPMQGGRQMLLLICLLSLDSLKENKGYIHIEDAPQCVMDIVNA
jgi:hypothetical protein